MVTDRTEKMVSFFRDLLGERYVSTSTFEKIKNIIDPFPYKADENAMPYVVVLPETKEQVSEILKYANVEKIPVFVRGSGTQLAGSSRPHTSGIVLNTRRMSHVALYEDYGFFECGPGVRCAEMARVLEGKGYFLPLWPGSRKIASMGGLISNNTSAHIIDAAIGKPSDYVLGLEVVLPTGEIIETGTRGLRRPAGTDLTKYFVGGDGILGVIVNIRMRLVPAYREAYSVAVFRDLRSLARAVQRVYRDRAPLPLFMEFMAKETAEIGYRVKGLEPPAGPVLLSMSVGATQDEADYKMEGILAAIGKEGPLSAEMIRDHEEWHKVLATREVIAPYVMQLTKSQLVTSEIVANLAQLEEAIEEAQRLHEGIPVLEECQRILYGHIGGLTIHAAYLLPPHWDDDKLREAVSAVFRREAELNAKYGTCGGEWGQFSKRQPFFVLRYGQEAYELIKRIKAAFDPNNILNPGILEGYR